jgi:hypothetical protein
MQILSLGVTTSISFERKKERSFLIEQFIAFLLISKHHHHDHHHSNMIPDTIGKQQLSLLFLLSSSKLNISIGISYTYIYTHIITRL